MDLDAQTIFNAAVSLACMLGGWILNTIRQDIMQVSQAQQETARKVAHIEVLVVGDYVKREELNASINKLEAKIDRLSDALESGFDKLHDKVNAKADR